MDCAIPYVGPLKFIDRLRVILVVYAWICLFVFLPCQVYLYLPLLGIQVKGNYRLSLLSFYAEIMVLIIAFGLPSIQGMFQLYSKLYNPVLDANRTRAVSSMELALYILGWNDWFFSNVMEGHIKL